LCENQYNEIITSVFNVIDSVNLPIVSGSSKQIREQILAGLRKRGWSSEIKLSSTSKISITAMNRRYALCLQTGNMGRFYADLLKLQYLFNKGSVDSAIYIVPSKQIARIIGSNVANFERLVDELKLFEKIITIPTVIIGLNSGE
jgi:hypothetical protein